MKHPERDIERVLAGLRDSPLPRGMEDRILAALEERKTNPSSRWFALSPTGLKIAVTCSLAMAAAALIVFFYSGRHTKHASQPPAAALATPQPLPPAVNTEIATIKSIPLTQTTKLRRVPVDLSHQQADANETGPISTPAPPIPLTEQERILLRFARHGRTDDLAQISNDRKAAKEDQEKQEFQAFFEPPPIKIGESE